MLKHLKKKIKKSQCFSSNLHTKSMIKYISYRDLRNLLRQSLSFKIKKSELLLNIFCLYSAYRENYLQYRCSQTSESTDHESEAWNSKHYFFSILVALQGENFGHSRRSSTDFVVLVYFLSFFRLCGGNRYTSQRHTSVHLSHLAPVPALVFNWEFLV